MISVFLVDEEGRTLPKLGGRDWDLKVLYDWSCYGVRESCGGLVFLDLVEENLRWNESSRISLILY